MITLVLGGTRSGKSVIAEALLATMNTSVTYLATAEAGDDREFLDRVAQHKRRRSREWTTIECGANLIAALNRIEGAILIDSLGTWLAGWRDFKVDTEALLEALSRRSGDVVIVSDEVGLGVHPSTDVGRAFRDAMGSLNQSVAERADRVVLVVAGQVLTLKSEETQ